MDPNYQRSSSGHYSVLLHQCNESIRRFGFRKSIGLDARSLGNLRMGLDGKRLQVLFEATDAAQTTRRYFAVSLEPTSLSKDSRTLHGDHIGSEG
jgi:hypothetical protein